ncbi:MAG: hypothetical protein NTW59_03500, partial [Candidatus Diapherotrites archaeon]|nr:hypothetical protein [Candidatus Diapherotrites archaeon]
MAAGRRLVEACALALLLIFSALPATAYSFCSFAGPDISVDNIELRNFTVEGAQNPTLGDTVTVKFQLKNAGQADANLSTSGIFAASIDPTSARKDFGSLFGGRILKPLETLNFEGNMPIDKGGIWEVWPSYEILKQGTFMGNPIMLNTKGPDHWQSCFLYLCPNYCENSVRYYEGYVGQESACVYQQETCKEGCDAQGIGCKQETAGDKTAPTVSAFHSPADANTESQVKFTAQARDSAGITSISIFVNATKQKECTGTGLAEKNDKDGKYWECSFTGGPYGFGTVTYSASAADPSNNTSASVEKSLSVALAVYSVTPTYTYKACFNSVIGRITEFPYPREMLKVQLCEA